MQAHVNGINIGYDTYGEGELALVLLHAFPLNREQWRSQAEALAHESRLRIITPDLRGFGESSVSVGPTTVEQMASDTFALLDALNIPSAIIGGLSMGGYVAFACQHRAPERIRAFILADTRAAADSAEAREARETTALYAEEHGGGALVERDKHKFFSHVTLAQHPEVIDHARQIAATNSAIGIAAASRGLGLRPDSTELLPRIACPTLVIVGEQDALTPVTDARILFERISLAQLEVITDAGHLSNLERPDVFTGLVARFLRERISESA